LTQKQFSANLVMPAGHEATVKAMREELVAEPQYWLASPKVTTYVFRY
jgi:hypothetical protein